MRVVERKYICTRERIFGWRKPMWFSNGVLYGSPNTKSLQNWIFFVKSEPEISDSKWYEINKKFDMWKNLLYNNNNELNY